MKRSDTTRYDRYVSRLWVLPLVLLLAVSGTTYALAKWHPATPGLPKISGNSVVLGDQYRDALVVEDRVMDEREAGRHRAGQQAITFERPNERAAGQSGPLLFVKP